MDVFPVRVTVDGQVHEHCKMFVDGAGTRIYTWDRRASTAVPVVLSDATATGGPRRWTLTTEAGDVEIAKSGGCGCSHPLKRWRPEAGAARVVAG